MGRDGGGEQEGQGLIKEDIVKKTKDQQGRPKGERLIVVGSEPMRRRLPNGMILTAVNLIAQAEFDPMIVVDELERQWRSS